MLFARTLPRIRSRVAQLNTGVRHSQVPPSVLRRTVSNFEVTAAAGAATGIPVMAHIGLTPQSVNALGGYRVQGRGDEAAHRLLLDAKALQQAGAFAVVLEVAASLAAASRVRSLIDTSNSRTPKGPAARESGRRV